MSVNFFVNGRAGDELRAALCGVAALSAGFCGGFIGAGGGLIMLLTLRGLYGKNDKTAYCAALCSVLPMTALSAAIYIYKNGFDGVPLAAIVPAAAAGGVCGAFLMKKLRARTLTVLFSALALIGGAASLLR